MRESRRAKRLSIKVYPRGRVEVVVPKRTRAADVQAFIEANREWIERSRASFATVVPPEPFVLPNRIELPAIGQSFRVRYERRTGAATVKYRSGSDVVTLRGRTGDDAECVAALRRWLAAVAKKEFLPRLRALSELTDNPFQRMHVRCQKTCWGSHSSTGTISMNFCLLFLEPDLLRYLMIHELCHARHMNHSRRFWQRVGRFEPDYERLDKALGESWKSIPAWLGIY
ncbi:MAG: SprT family zinc-dependent metalloprotease [Woeseiaceae bacterium]|nr:SprT family zinc-dependent metalloprotease [Woeseiaceae bacterium]